MPYSEAAMDPPETDEIALTRAARSDPSTFLSSDRTRAPKKADREPPPEIVKKNAVRGLGPLAAQIGFSRIDLELTETDGPLFGSPEIVDAQPVARIATIAINAIGLVGSFIALSKVSRVTIEVVSDLEGHASIDTKFNHSMQELACKIKEAVRG